MTTATLSPTQTQSVEHRLAACQGLIRDAAWHCANRHRREREPEMFEDMAQEATIAVWRGLQKDPTIPVGYIWLVAYTGALHALRSGKSVDSPRVDRRDNYQVFSLESLLENKDGWDTIEEALARRKRRGEIPDPTNDVAVTQVMLHELWQRLTLRQRQVLGLRLQQYSESEAGTVLGVSQAQVSRLVIAIRIKALAAWGDKPEKPARARLTPEEARERRKERDRAKQRRYRQLGKSWAQRHRDQVNARRRALRREKREIPGLLYLNYNFPVTMTV